MPELLALALIMGGFLAALIAIIALIDPQAFGG